MLLLVVGLFAVFCGCFYDPLKSRFKQNAKDIDAIISKNNYNSVKDFPIVVYTESLTLVDMVLVNDVEDKCDCLIDHATQLGLFGLANGRTELFNKVAHKGRFISIIKPRYFIAGESHDDENYDFYNKYAPIDLMSEFLSTYKIKSVFRLLEEAEKVTLLYYMLTTEYPVVQDLFQEYFGLLKYSAAFIGLLELQMKYLVIYNSFNPRYFSFLKGLHLQKKWTMFNQLSVVVDAKATLTPNTAVTEVVEYFLKSKIPDSFKRQIVTMALPSENNDLMDYLFHQDKGLDYMAALSISMGKYSKIKLQSVFRKYLNVKVPVRQYGLLLPYLFMYGHDYGLELASATRKGFYLKMRTEERIHLDNVKDYLFKAIVMDKEENRVLKQLMAEFYIYTLAIKEGRTDEEYLEKCDEKLREHQLSDNPIKQYLPALDVAE